MTDRHTIEGQMERLPDYLRYKTYISRDDENLTHKRVVRRLRTNATYLNERCPDCGRSAFEQDLERETATSEW